MLITSDSPHAAKATTPDQALTIKWKRPQQRTYLLLGLPAKSSIPPSERVGVCRLWMRFPLHVFENSRSKSLTEQASIAFSPFFLHLLINQSRINLSILCKAL